MSKFIYEDEKSYRKAMYLIALQNLATTQTNFHMLCRIISDIETETDYKEILKMANEQQRKTVIAFAEIFDKQAKDDREDIILSKINLDDLLNM